MPTTPTLDLTTLEPRPSPPVESSTPTSTPIRTAPESAAILLGADRHRLDTTRPIGFSPTSDPDPAEPTSWYDRSEAHGLVVAPTGAGKTTWLACQLARHLGSVVVLDPKGELAAMTARRRLALGNEVAVIDPFSITRGFDLPLTPECPDPFGAGPSADLPTIAGRFDPGHWLTGSETLEDDAMALAAEIHSAPHARDPFWSQAATDLTAALILHVYQDPVSPPSWAAVSKLLFTADFDMTIATALDKGMVTNPTAQESLGAYLCHPERETRPSVLSTARAGMRAFHTPGIRRATSGTSFDAEGLVSGARPVTVYLVIPPQNMVSHAPVVRLWLTALLRALTGPERAQRDRTPSSTVLVLLDELPALGRMTMIPSLYAYLRSYGVRAVSIVQSLAQLDAAYGDESRVIRENAGLRAAFGVTDGGQAEAVAQMLDTTAGRVLDLGREEMLVRVPDGAATCLRADHRDPRFVPTGFFDPNPFHRDRARQAAR